MMDDDRRGFAVPEPGDALRTWEDAGSALGPIVDALPPAVRELLANLRPPQTSGRSRRGSPAGRPLLEPGLFREALLTEAPGEPAGPLSWIGAVHRQDPDGRPLRAWWSGTPLRPGPTHLVLAPDGVDPTTLPRGGPLPDGVSAFTWSVLETVTGPPETIRSVTRGDLTRIDLRGTVVLVQRTGPRTSELSWPSRPGGALASVSLRAPFPPVEAVERLVRDTVLLPPV